MYTDVKKNYGVFFNGENTDTKNIALTSASANHVANMAKEYTQAIKHSLEGVKLVNRTMKLVSANIEHFVQKGIGNEELAGLETQLAKVGKCNALIAWIREAIKAKDSLLKIVEGLTVEQYCEAVGKEFPKPTSPGIPFSKLDFCKSRNLKRIEEPVCEEVIDENEAISLLEENERNQYLMLTAEQDALNALVGEDGTLSVAVRELQLRTNNAVENGVSYTPSVNAESVFALHHKLQGQLAKVSANLMELNEKVQNLISADTFRKNEAFEHEKLEYEKLKNKREVVDLEFDKEVDNYNKAVSCLNAEMEAFKIREKKSIGEWKIIIPEALVEIYNEVNGLGK